MKIVKIDKLGRIVIPMTYRKQLGIKEHDDLSILFNGNTIIISPTNSICKICGSKAKINNKMQICAECIKEVKSL